LIFKIRCQRGVYTRFQYWARRDAVRSTDKLANNRSVFGTLVRIEYQADSVQIDQALAKFDSSLLRDQLQT
jgi:hypothetical protein